MPGTCEGLLWSSYKTSWTGRPIRPPFAFISSSQIFIATSDDFPFAASGPVSDMLNPILIGSAASAGDPSPTAASATDSAAPQINRHLVNCSIDSSLEGPLGPMFL